MFVTFKGNDLLNYTLIFGIDYPLCNLEIGYFCPICLFFADALCITV